MWTRSEDPSATPSTDDAERCRGGRYLHLVGILTDYFAATPEEALPCAAHGPLGTDLPMTALKWAVDGVDYSIDDYMGQR